jgi:IMP cyclohydrolase
MAISKDNRALRRFLGWIAEGDLEVIVWRTDDETPVLVSLVDINESPPHAITLQLTDSEEGEQADAPGVLEPWHP